MNRLAGSGKSVASDQWIVVRRATCEEERHLGEWKAGREEGWKDGRMEEGKTERQWLVTSF